MKSSKLQYIGHSKSLLRDHAFNINSAKIIYKTISIQKKLHIHKNYLKKTLLIVISQLFHFEIVRLHKILLFLIYVTVYSYWLSPQNSNISIAQKIYLSNPLPIYDQNSFLFCTNEGTLNGIETEMQYLVNLLVLKTLFYLFIYYKLI